MKIQIDNIFLTPDEPADKIPTFILKHFGCQITDYRIVRKSLDARNKSNIIYKYRIVAEVSDETAIPLLVNKDITEYRERYERAPFPNPVEQTVIKKGSKIIIAGFGPAGMFTALRLIDAGYIVRIIERGKMVDERIKDIKALEREGILNTESNVLFGEGGAGTYSDGKLTARTGRPEMSWLFLRLIRAGAPESITYEARPHLGTDRLGSIVQNIRKEIIDAGSEIIFNERIDDILLRNSRVAGIKTSSGHEYPCDILILATGHSARDIYELLNRKRIIIEKKDFAVGVRVEHPLELINSIQYGNSRYRDILPAADYSLAYKNERTGRGTYSFCMCPGGSVINSSSESGLLCNNGMSFSGRDFRFSNSAIIVTVKKDDFYDGGLGGIEFQRMLERSAFHAGGGAFRAPAQRMSSFMARRCDSSLPESSYRNGITSSDINLYMPSWITDEIKMALSSFNRKMKGFISDNGLLIGAETRSSSPVRITRGDDFQSVNTPGLYPVGEGSGYAGGIVSSAVDGIRAADCIIEMKK